RRQRPILVQVAAAHVRVEGGVVGRAVLGQRRRRPERQRDTEERRDGLDRSPAAAGGSAAQGRGRFLSQGVLELQRLVAGALEVLRPQQGLLPPVGELHRDAKA